MLHKLNFQSIVVAISLFASIAYASEIAVSRAEYGNKWPYTIPEGTLNCEVRMAGGYKKQDVTISSNGKTYAINGSARSSGKYLPLEKIWRDDPNFPGLKIPDNGVIQKGLTLCH